MESVGVSSSCITSSNCVFTAHGQVHFHCGTRRDEIKLFFCDVKADAWDTAIILCCWLLRKFVLRVRHSIFPSSLITKNGRVAHFKCWQTTQQFCTTSVEVGTCKVMFNFHLWGYRDVRAPCLSELQKWAVHVVDRVYGWLKHWKCSGIVNILFQIVKH